MDNSYNLSYTARQIDEKLKRIDNISDKLDSMNKINIEKVLLYYGDPVAIGGTYNVSGAVNIYKNYDIVILGDTYQSPSHEVYDDTVAIIKELSEKYPEIRIVGYVPIGLHPDWTESNLDMDELKRRVDQWSDIGAKGIFLDEFGYDYYVTRERQNEIVGYCHSKGLFVFANSWSLEYCFNNEPITIDWLNNFEANPEGLPSMLNENDYYLFENLFFTVSDTQIIECGDVWRFDNLCKYFTEERIEGKSFYDYYGTKLCSLDAIHSELPAEQKKQLRTISLIGAAIFNINAVAFGDEHWGSAGNFDQWDVPDIDIVKDNYHTITADMKVIVDENGEEDSFYYKWSASTNGKTYSLVWDVPNASHNTWVDGMRYVTIDDTVIENAWLSIFNFQSEIAKVDGKIQEGLSVIDSGVSQIREALNEIDQKASEIDSEIGKIDEALVGVQDVVEGFAFREVQW